MSKNGSLIASEILIVDDEEDIRDLVAGILHDEGYTTRVAGDSDEMSSASLAAVCIRAASSYEAIRAERSLSPGWAFR